MPEDRDALVDRGIGGKVMDALWPILGGDLLPAETWHEINDVLASILPPTTSAGDGELVERTIRLDECDEDQIAFYWKQEADIARAQHAAAAARVKELEEALTRIRDHDGVSYRFGDEVRAIASAALNPSPTEQGEPR